MVYSYLFRPSSSAAITRRKLLNLLKPNFLDKGCNKRLRETKVEDVFVRYTRQTATGQRGSVIMEHISQFVTCSDSALSIEENLFDI